MNIIDLKQTIANKLGISLPTLQLVRQKNQEDEPQPWVSHWDNDKRVRIVMHDDVLDKIKTEPAFAGLAVKYEDVPATDARAAYKRAIIITPNDIVATF